MTRFTYKGFDAAIQYDHEDKIFFGRVGRVDDIVGFHATDVAEMRKAFCEAVDDYLATRISIANTRGSERNLGSRPA